jgi:hypothetical protein
MLSLGWGFHSSSLSKSQASTACKLLDLELVSCISDLVNGSDADHKGERKRERKREKGVRLQKLWHSHFDFYLSYCEKIVFFLNLKPDIHPPNGWAHKTIHPFSMLNQQFQNVPERSSSLPPSFFQTMLF